ncbi:MAG: sugar ABC transporter ATP-binding protein [Pirellulaceae bacterium]|nr:sugar ABC transporter ATP-binding protein [Pirellulaceae bacterium]
MMHASLPPSLAEPVARLVMERIAKRFGATQALQGVSLSAFSGQTLALIGENGAGKSTLMKVLSGAHAPDLGSMTIDGRPFNPRGPHEARQAGIAMIYQELSMAPDLSVEDNIMLGKEQASMGLVRRGTQRQQIREAMNLLGYPEIDLRRSVGSLSIGTQQIVEIARGMVSNARVMIFDEPTSSLPHQAVRQLFATIKRLEQKGLAIIYISHFLEEIREVARDYVVLRDGKPIGAGQLVDVSDAQIVAMMVGRSVDQLFPHVPHEIRERILQIQQLSGDKLPIDVSFDLRRGEIFGLFGLIGAGRTETLRLLFGLERCASGGVLVHAKRSRETPAARIDAGLGLVSEDRKREGLAQSMSIADNLTLSRLQPYSKAGVLQLSKRRSVVRHWMTQLSVKAHSPEQTIGQLSGGNQQKVAIARVLHQEAEILLLDEPTRGIDVATKSEIYQRIGELAASGKAIIFVSSYLPELMAVCDTLGVMARGHLRSVRPMSQWTENEVLSVAVDSQINVENS